MAATPRFSANASALFARCTDGGANDGNAVEITCDSNGAINLSGSLTLNPTVTSKPAQGTAAAEYLNSGVAGVPFQLLAPAGVATLTLGQQWSVPTGCTHATFYVTYAIGAGGGSGYFAAYVYKGNGTAFLPVQKADGSGTALAALGNTSPSILGNSWAFDVELLGGETKVGLAVLEAGDTAHPGTVLIRVTTR